MDFVVQKAVREKIYVKIALMAPSGGGKTYSALRLATGMADEMEKQTGNRPKILLANTESARGRYYANEFDYDIVDLSAPYNPELFVEVIEFAIKQGYGILVMDSTSPEWEGKGGCLELQQQAGGTWQSWKKVTPRHDKFIYAMADSPIHIIATMRGKDQYEADKDEKGKTSVKKLGVGAKQREGFEYEFTCTFTVDQKTHMAETQKDNTHIFEDDIATLLTENHGRKIIQWANTSDVNPAKIVRVSSVSSASEQPEEVLDSDENIQDIKAEILKLATALTKTEKKEATIAKMKEFEPSANPNRIKDVEVAKALLDALKQI